MTELSETAVARPQKTRKGLACDAMYTSAKHAKLWLTGSNPFKQRRRRTISAAAAEATTDKKSKK